MGAVVEGEHTGTGRRVAIKLVTREILHDQKQLVRFQLEARSASSIDSEHIVQVLDWGIDEATGLPFMVMELLVGEDLQQLLQRLGPLPAELALRITAQACRGLAKAHAAGVVHRDIKPGNIFLAQRDDSITVKLLDFGIAKITSEAFHRAEEGGLTRTGSMIGSPHYMSPEQAQGLKTIDGRSDIWSLGVVLYKALAGRTPKQDTETLG